MEQISWSEQVVEYFDQAYLGVFENKRMLIANATVKKMGLQRLFIEDFEDNNYYTTPREPLRGCMVTPPRPWPNRFL